MGSRDNAGLGRPKNEHPATEAGEEKAAFEHLRSGLHRYLLRQIRRPEDIEDLTQEVYLRLMRFGSRETRLPKAYVFRVAFNVLYEFRHRQRRARVSFDSVCADQASRFLADETASMDEVYDRERREREIEALVARLPPMQRAVLILATREHLSYEHIAEKLGISASTARVHLFRATSFLRHELSKE